MLGTREEQQEQMKEMALLAEKENNSHCKKCCGTGHQGWHIELKQYLPCSCLEKAAHRIVRKKHEETKD